MVYLRYEVLGIFLVCLASGHRVLRQADLTPDVDQRFLGTACTVNGQAGKCVDESFCNEDHTILPGGVIDDSEYRNRNKCPREFEWCCTQTIATPNVETSTDIGCTAPKPDTCPWCVSLYKSGGIKVTKTGLFCMGALIGSKVILTAATCLKAAQKQLLWARVPLSADPRRNYTVRFRQAHPLYDTGSHTHDYAILLLEDDVIWPNNEWKGACLDFQTPMAGVCMTFGLDKYEDYVSTILDTKKGSCFANAKMSDAMCGELIDDYCFVTTGSPVLCRIRGSMLLAGVSRSPCFRQSQALLGSLALSGDWLEKELQVLGLVESQYTKTLSLS